MVAAVLDWMIEDGRRLAECRHDHPFAILGPQPSDTGWTVRAWMPEADRVDLVVNGEVIGTQTPNHPWVFEAQLTQDPGQSYRLQVSRGGINHEQNDPWAFRDEWMGEMDRHLFAQGNHHHIWRKMGAHLTTIAGVEGVMFCLWAPHARSVSVIGDLNSWDGRHHPMQQRTGGIWELFIPGMQEGALYKYEIRTQEGHCYQKADPYGFRHEVRPDTSSLVSRLDNFQWSDGSWMTARDSRNALDQPISVYEMHLGSWIHAAADQPFIEADGTPRTPVPAADLKPGARLLTYPELADRVIPYV